MDKIIIGTARNVDAEYAEGTGVREHAFVLVHQYNGETVTVEGFKTKEACLHEANTEYAGVEREELWIELD